MSRDTTITILDVVGADYPKEMLEKEPVLLRRVENIRQVKNGSVNITNEAQRLAINKTGGTYNNDNAILTSNNVMQMATVNDLQGVYDYIKAGIIDITVKYSLRFNSTTIAPYYVAPSEIPNGSDTPQSGDLAISIYESETPISNPLPSLRYGMYIPSKVYMNNAGANGLNPNINTAPITGAGYPLYKYDGTGWIPLVLDNSTGITEYRIKVLRDYGKYYNLIDNISSHGGFNLHEEKILEYYHLIYYPTSGTTAPNRCARFVGLDYTNLKVADLDCGSTN